MITEQTTARPKLHSPLPARPGERDLAGALCRLPDDALHLWFGVDHLPGVGDIDLLIWHEHVGVFVVEVKAVPLSEIEFCDLRRMKIRGRHARHTATYQAFKAMQSLLSFLTGEHPLLTATACFPLITRREWQQFVADDDLMVRGAESILFRDDLETATSLQHRLLLIRERPAHGRPAHSQSPPGTHLLQRFADELRIRVDDELTIADVNRIALLRAKHRRDEFAPATARSRVAFVGHPGTGKTIQLVRAAIQHAAVDKRVLVLCFNKVLGSDLKRLLSGVQVRGKIDVYDLYELLTEVNEAEKLNAFHSPGPEEGAIRVLQHLHDHRPPPYDTVVIDEGQDVPGWTRRLVEVLTTENSSILAAFGRGQHLYGDSEDSLLNLGLAKRDLKRNFRNTRLLFQFAQTFYETRLRVDRIPRVVARFRNDDGSALLFDREIGPPIAIETSPGLFGWRNVQRLEAIIKDALNQLNRSNTDQLELLILVPREGAREHASVLEALRRLSCDFVDYATNSARRRIARRSAVRVSTFHSARGLEAARVLVFGLTQLQKVAQEDPEKAASLAYVVLSRSTNSCSIHFEKEDVDHPLYQFTAEVDRALREATG